MQLYRFQTIDPANRRYDLPARELADMPAVWREIARIASARAVDGGQIRVIDENGAIVVLVGVSTARALRAA